MDNLGAYWYEPTPRERLELHENWIRNGCKHIRGKLIIVEDDREKEKGDNNG